jgi:hypothetical protein
VITVDVRCDAAVGEVVKWTVVGGEVLSERRAEMVAVRVSAEVGIPVVEDE